MTSSAPVLEQLSALGRTAVRQTQAKHGAQGPAFGVRLADLDALAKRHRGDHQLALELWASTNVDARLLAMRIANPQQITSAQLDRWLADLRWPTAVDQFVAALVIKTPHAQAKSTAWRKARDEYKGRAGWTLIAHQARDQSLPDARFATCINEIVSKIHKAPNYKREAMNTALIAIGGYRLELREQALLAADQIGKVEVDHGETHCQTPAARLYIEAMTVHSPVNS